MKFILILLFFYGSDGGPTAVKMESYDTRADCDGAASRIRWANPSPVEQWVDKNKTCSKDGVACITPLVHIDNWTLDHIGHLCLEVPR